MAFSDAEVTAIVEAAASSGEPCVSPRWAVGLRRMLGALADLEFSSRNGSSLLKLCEAGARYGWQELEGTTSRELLGSLSKKVNQSLRSELRRNLTRVTRPCLELERTSFGLALNALGLRGGATDPRLVERMFLGKKTCDRLFSIFRKFPVLARLWSQLILQWRDHVTEILERFALDRIALSRTFFGGKPLRTIVDIRCGLSDSHSGGRTVTQLRFEAGSVIYKPRSGETEWEWFSLVQWMNTHSCRPKLKAGRVLRRKGYCWMECMAAHSCKDTAAACRFYERIGGMIAAAYLVRAVDCHRDNVIASGEHPVLVDVDALWHVSRLTKTQSFSDVLYRTGFLPNSNRRSLQSRSSALGPGTSGNHLARIAGQPLQATHYQREIVSGFARAWRCILRTRNQRSAFARRLRRIRSKERRWIYWATEKYAAIRRASIQPAVLSSGPGRDLLIARLCKRNTVTAALIDAEVRALKRLDIPYFVRTSNEPMTPDKDPMPLELVEAIRRALQS